MISSQQMTCFFGMETFTRVRMKTFFNEANDKHQHSSIYSYKRTEWFCLISYFDSTFYIFSKKPEGFMQIVSIIYCKLPVLEITKMGIHEKWSTLACRIIRKNDD